MTAEQLEELLGKVEPDYWQYSSAEGRRVWMSPEINRRSSYARIGMLERRLYSEYAISSLARRVIAAEKLVEVCEEILDRGYISSAIEEERHDHNALVAALTAYREASK